MSDNKSCGTSECPVTSKLSSWLCIIKKVLLIIVLIGLALVLFDLHGMFKAQREYTNAVTAAVANAQGGGAGAGQMAAPQAQ